MLMKREIQDIKESQEADMQRSRQLYEEYVLRIISGNSNRARVFLEVDGFRTRKEITDSLDISQPTVWRAFDYLENMGLIIPLGETRKSSSIYGKPRWVRTLRIDEFVKEKILVD